MAIRKINSNGNAASGEAPWALSGLFLVIAILMAAGFSAQTNNDPVLYLSQAVQSTQQYPDTVTIVVHKQKIFDPSNGRLFNQQNLAEILKAKKGIKEIHLGVTPQTTSLSVQKVFDKLSQATLIAIGHPLPVIVGVMDKKYSRKVIFWANKSSGDQL
jgi:hypothetical protein